MTEILIAPHGKIDISKVEAILFDVDGTLSNTDDRMVERIADKLLRFNWLFKGRNPKNFSRRLIMAVETPGNFFYNLADRLGIDSLFAKLLNVFTAKRKPHKAGNDRFWIIPGICELLNILKKDYALGVVSARDSSSTMAFLEFFNLSSFFNVVVTSQTCRLTKPFPDPVIYAANALEVLPENCLMVGDTVVDIRSGKAAGAQTIGVLCGFGTEKELKRAGADMILSSTADMAAFFHKNP